MVFEDTAGGSIVAAMAGGIDGYGIAYLDPSVTPPALRFRRVSASGLSAEITIAEVTDPMQLESPTLVRSAAGFFVAWTERGDGAPQARGRIVSAEGALVDGELAKDIAPAGSSSPALTLVSDRIYLGYIDEAVTPSVVRHRRLSETGEGVSDPVLVHGGLHAIVRVASASLGLDGVYLAFSRASGDLLGRRVAVGGDPAGETPTLTHATAAFDGEFRAAYGGVTVGVPYAESVEGIRSWWLRTITEQGGLGPRLDRFSAVGEPRALALARSAGGFAIAYRSRRSAQNQVRAAVATFDGRVVFERTVLPLEDAEGWIGIAQSDEGLLQLAWSDEASSGTTQLLTSSFRCNP